MDYKSFFESDGYFDAVAKRKPEKPSEKPSAPERPPETSCGPVGSPRPSSPVGSGIDALGLPLAIAYVPRQAWRELYEPEKALSRGTVFKELDKPYKYGEGGYRGR